MSDTPRTDAAMGKLRSECDDVECSHDILGLDLLCRQLERELTAANQRVQDLESQITALPDPDLRPLGTMLADMLDSDKWNNVEPYLEAINRLLISERQRVDGARQAAIAECADAIRKHFELAKSMGAYETCRALGSAMESVERLSTLPPSHVVVPVEPTEEMVEAMGGCLLKTFNRVTSDEIRKGYKAMIARKP